MDWRNKTGRLSRKLAGAWGAKDVGASVCEASTNKITVGYFAEVCGEVITAIF